MEDTDILIEELLDTDLESDVSDPAYLIVHNDEFNTFEWVIECFKKVLKHTSEQAEQLAYIIHFKGKATVKAGSMDTLRPYKDALCERGLGAVIEQ